jgi:hypothetical protein
VIAVTTNDRPQLGTDIDFTALFPPPQPCPNTDELGPCWACPVCGANEDAGFTLTPLEATAMYLAAIEMAEALAVETAVGTFVVRGDLPGICPVDDRTWMIRFIEGIVGITAQLSVGEVPYPTTPAESLGLALVMSLTRVLVREQWLDPDRSPAPLHRADPDVNLAEEVLLTDRDVRGVFSLDAPGQPNPGQARPRPAASDIARFEEATGLVVADPSAWFEPFATDEA